MHNLPGTKEFERRSSVPRLEVYQGREVETGRHVFLLEYVDEHGRCGVGDYEHPTDMLQATADWKSDGVPIVWDPDGTLLS